MNSDQLDGLNLTRDLFLGGKIALWQSAQGYRAGIDPVLLAAFIEPKSSQKILDLGCGVGAISLCLLAHHPNIFVTGLENVQQFVTLAERNAQENNFSDRFIPILGSVADLPSNITPNSFDLVISNPPYAAAGTTNPSPNFHKKSSHVEAEASLDKWINVASKALKHKGIISLIHRADRLDHLLAILRLSFGEIIIHPLWPKAGKQAKRVLVRAKKGSQSPTRLTAGTVLHTNNGSYTEDINCILQGKSLLTVT